MQALRGLGKGKFIADDLIIINILQSFQIFLRPTCRRGTGQLQPYCSGGTAIANHWVSRYVANWALYVAV